MGTGENISFIVFLRKIITEFDRYPNCVFVFVLGEHE
jgi:hypothetical protein